MGRRFDGLRHRLRVMFLLALPEGRRRSVPPWRDDPRDDDGEAGVREPRPVAPQSGSATAVAEPEP